MELNEYWEWYIKDKGADFVCFVDASSFLSGAVDGYTCVILFGKAISREYINAHKAGQKPKRKEVINSERKMDSLANKIADQLEEEGYKSITKLKFRVLPHKTVALKAGLGFIGKNNLLVTDQFGCAVMLGKVLTTAPFVTMSKVPKEPQCNDCSICVDVCSTKSLLGKTWSVTTKRDEIMVRSLCSLCHKCMIWCPYTERYAKTHP